MSKDVNWAVLWKKQAKAQRDRCQVLERNLGIWKASSFFEHEKLAKTRKDLKLARATMHDVAVYLRGLGMLDTASKLDRALQQTLPKDDGENG